MSDYEVKEGDIALFLARCKRRITLATLAGKLLRLLLKFRFEDRVP